MLLEARRMRQFARDARREERRRREETALSRRRLIYSAGLRVLHMGSNEYSQFRDISPQFFSANPAVTHRLVPWLRRELSVLFDNQEEHVTFMTHYILSLITNVDIQSEEFHINLRPFLHDTVEHFVHEFANYARSPFDMDTYDQMSQYDFSGNSTGRLVRPPVRRTSGPLVASLQEDSDSDEPSVILLSDHDSEPMVISDGDGSGDEVEQVGGTIEVTDLTAVAGTEDATVDAGEEQQQVFTINDDSPTRNPEPPPDFDIPGPSGLQSSGSTATAAAVDESVEEVGSPVEEQTTNEIHIKEEPPDFHDSDHSDIEFIAFLKPIGERTPEQMSLSSESETERIAHEEAERRWQEEKARRKKVRERMKQMQANPQTASGASSGNRGGASRGSDRQRHRSRSNSYDRSRRRSRSHDSRQRRSRSSDIFVFHRSRSRDRHTYNRSRSKSKSPPPKSWRERFGYVDSSPSPPRVSSKASKKKSHSHSKRDNGNSHSKSRKGRSRSKERSSSRSRQDSRSKQGSSKSRRDDNTKRRKDEGSRKERSRSREERSSSRSRTSHDKGHSSKHKKSKSNKKHSKRRSRSRSRSKHH